MTRPPNPRWIAATNVVVVAALCGHVHAQSADAEQLFADGNKRMAEGKLAEACDAFEASNRIEPRAGTLIRLGECREQRHELASAWSAYKDALTRVKDRRKREVAARHVAALEPKLSFLTIHVGDRVAGLAITRDDKPFDEALWDRALPIDGGDYAIAAQAPGRRDWHATAHVPVEGGKIVIEVPRLADIPVAAAHHESPTIAPTPVAVRARMTIGDRPTLTIRRDVALGIAGVAVASAVAGVVLGQSARSKEHDAFALCPDASMACADAGAANALLRTGRSRALDANIGFGIAGAAAVGAVVLWLTGSAPTEHANIAIAPLSSPSEIGLVVTGRL